MVCVLHILWHKMRDNVKRIAGTERPQIETPAICTPSSTLLLLRHGQPEIVYTRPATLLTPDAGSPKRWRAGPVKRPDDSELYLCKKLQLGICYAECASRQLQWLLRWQDKMVSFPRQRETCSKQKQHVPVGSGYSCSMFGVWAPGTLPKPSVAACGEQ